MGEAKNRKNTESNFGRVPKSANFRGLVVSPPIEIDGTRLFVKSSQLDPQELRFALLFWDQLVWPSSKAIHIASGPEAAYLEEAGVLTRPDYTIYGDAAQGIAIGQIKAYQDLELQQPGVWALAQGENSFLLKDDFVEKEKGAMVELHRCIPIPLHDVPLEDILEFKHRRKDELILLRHQLESFITEIETADDKSVALAQRVKEIDLACANLLKVGKEVQFPVFLSNLKATFSLTPAKFLPAIAFGWKMGESFGLAAATAVAAGAGAISTLEIKADYGLRSVKKPMNPYKYAYQIHEELR